MARRNSSSIVLIITKNDEGKCLWPYPFSLKWPVSMGTLEGVIRDLASVSTMKSNSISERPPVVFVPGGINPAEISYGPLLNIIKDEVQPIVKDLEVYASDTPPADYGLEVEVEGIRRVADASNVKTFHLIGFSGGGSASLAFTAKYPEKLRSLALIEPAWIGNEDWTPEEVDFNTEIDRMMALPSDQLLASFLRLLLRPGVELPQRPAGPPPPWMAKRPAGIRAGSRAFKAYNLDRKKFHSFRRPVYYAYGSLSNPVWESMAKTLASLFPNFRVDLYEGLHHMNPPHRAEPERFAKALRELWAQAEAITPLAV